MGSKDRDEQQGRPDEAAEQGDGHGALPEPGTDLPPTREELEELRDHAARAAEYLDLAQRAAADLQNLQKRLGREKETARRLAVRDLVAALLPSFDNLERAIEAGGGGGGENLLEGVRMIHGQIQRALAEEGISVIEPEREDPLDPNLHEAVFGRYEEGVPEGAVLEVFEKGYRLGDLVVRPARVTVSAAGDTAPPGGPASEEHADEPTGSTRKE